MNEIPFIHILDIQNSHILGYTESYSDMFNTAMQEKTLYIHRECEPKWQ